MPLRDERLYIAESVEAIDRIFEYTEGGRDAFLGSQLIQDAVVKNLIVIGEAAKSLSEGSRAQAPEIPWSRVSGMRDRIVHAYFSIDLDIIWEVVDHELSDLRAALERIKPQT